MRIVVLDGYTLNPGDLDWKPLEAFGSLVVHDRTPVSQVVERSRGSEIVLTNKTVLSAEAIAALPDLRYIGVLATGYDVVDVRGALAGGIVVTNIPGYGSTSVAQHVFALLLELVCQTGAHAASVIRGDWTRSADFSHPVSTITELAGKTLGIIGLGAIGKRVALIAHGFGMRIIASEGRGKNPARLPGFLIHRLPLDEVFAVSDIVSLHCPLTPETRGLVNAERIARMKRTAILINTARGALVDEKALADALCAGELRGAALDVLSKEPPDPGNPLLTAPRCLITPHVAWASIEARRRLLHLAAENIRAFLDGKPINVVKGGD